MPLLPCEGHKIDDVANHAAGATATVRAAVELRVISVNAGALDAARSAVAGVH
jgi:hypothetical protein